MFGIGFLEICVILVVALVFFGPQKLPEIMKQAGRLYVQLRRMTNDVKSTMDTVIKDAEAELRKEDENIKKLAAIEQKNVTPPPHSDEAAPKVETRSRGIGDLETQSQG